MTLHFFGESCQIQLNRHSTLWATNPPNHNIAKLDGFFNQPLSQQSHEKCAIKWIKLHLPARPPTGLDNRLTRALEFQRWRWYNLLVSHNSNLHVTLQFIPKIRMPNEFYCTCQLHSFAATVTFDSVILNKGADNGSNFYESIRLQWWSDTDTLFRWNIDAEHLRFLCNIIMQFWN